MVPAAQWDGALDGLTLRVLAHGLRTNHRWWASGGSSSCCRSGKGAWRWIKLLPGIPVGP